MIDEKLLKNEEKAVFALRALYRKYGYQPFCMSKFEEYDLYAENKEFLVGDSVITFNDTDGRLLALKPDVTLSIIKNSKDEPGCKQKVCYNENVYRVSGKTHRYKEIMQAGLECIGDIDTSDIFEVLSLAAMSLAGISENFVLDISHMGIFSAILNEVSSSNTFKNKITKYISEKNRHEAESLCKEYGISDDSSSLILSFIGMYGNMSDVLCKLKPICKSEKAAEAYAELEILAALLSKTEFADRIRFDFSVVNDMNYYSGIVFRGFLEGVYEGVLAGGEYGALMRRMGRVSNAIGFALYLDLLDSLDTNVRQTDVDVLLIYSEETDTGAIIAKKNEIMSEGMSVSAQRSIPEKLRYKKIIEMQ